MKIIDISWPLEINMTEYKNRNTLKTVFWSTHSENNMRQSTIFMDSHTGTHIDAPAHFLKHGKTTSDIDLSKLITKCLVIDCTSISGKITANNLEKIDFGDFKAILLKTKNSYLNHKELFNPDFVYLNKTGAEFLVRKKIELVGIGYLGIERNQRNHETHRLLLDNDIIILEGLRLGHIEPEVYKLICLPLKVSGLEAAPARAILIDAETI